MNRIMKEFENTDADSLKGGKENPFIVPDDYFSNLPGRIQSYCHTESRSEQNVSWVFAFRSQIALAAGFILLALFAYFGLYISQPINQSGETDYVYIVEKNISEFDELDIYDALLNSNKTQRDSLFKIYEDFQLDYFLKDNTNNVTLIQHSKEIKP